METQKAQKSKTRKKRRGQGSVVSGPTEDKRRIDLKADVGVGGSQSRPIDLRSQVEEDEKNLDLYSVGVKPEPPIIKVGEEPSVAGGDEKNGGSDGGSDDGDSSRSHKDGAPRKTRTPHPSHIRSHAGSRDSAKPKSLPELVRPVGPVIVQPDPNQDQNLRDSASDSVSASSHTYVSAPGDTALASVARPTQGPISELCPKKGGFIQLNQVQHDTRSAMVNKVMALDSIYKGLLCLHATGAGKTAAGLHAARGFLRKIYKEHPTFLSYSNRHTTHQSPLVVWVAKDSTDGKNMIQGYQDQFIQRHLILDGQAQIALPIIKVISYDAFIRMVKYKVHGKSDDTTKDIRDLHDRLKLREAATRDNPAAGAELFVIDEAHNLFSPVGTIKRASKGRSLGVVSVDRKDGESVKAFFRQKKNRYVLLMTATPTHGGIQTYYELINTCLMGDTFNTSTPPAEDIVKSIARDVISVYDPRADIQLFPQPVLMPLQYVKIPPLYHRIRTYLWNNCVAPKLGTPEERTRAFILLQSLSMGLSSKYAWNIEPYQDTPHGLDQFLEGWFKDKSKTQSTWDKIKDIRPFSPKLARVAKNIVEQDEADKTQYGRIFKHAILTHISEEKGETCQIYNASGRSFLQFTPEWLYRRMAQLLDHKQFILHQVDRPETSQAGRANHTDQEPTQKREKSTNVELFNRADPTRGGKNHIIIVGGAKVEGLDLRDVGTVHVLDLHPRDEANTQLLARCLRSCGSKQIPFFSGVGALVRYYVYVEQQPHRNMEESRPWLMHAHPRLMEMTRNQATTVDLIQWVRKYNISRAVKPHHPFQLQERSDTMYTLQGQTQYKHATLLFYNSREKPYDLLSLIKKKLAWDDTVSDGGSAPVIAAPSSSFLDKVGGIARDVRHWITGENTNPIERDKGVEPASNVLPLPSGPHGTLHHGHVPPSRSSSPIQIPTTSASLEPDTIPIPELALNHRELHISMPLYYERGHRMRVSPDQAHPHIVLPLLISMMRMLRGQQSGDYSVTLCLPPRYTYISSPPIHYFAVCVRPDGTSSIDAIVRQQFETWRQSGRTSHFVLPVWREQSPENGMLQFILWSRTKTRIRGVTMDGGYRPPEARSSHDTVLDVLRSSLNPRKAQDQRYIRTPPWSRQYNVPQPAFAVWFLHDVLYRKQTKQVCIYMNRDGSAPTLAYTQAIPTIAQAIQVYYYISTQLTHWIHDWPQRGVHTYWTDVSQYAYCAQRDLLRKLEDNEPLHAPRLSTTKPFSPQHNRYCQLT